MRSAFAFALCLPVVALTGCSFTPSAAPTPDPGLAIHGVVHGGQQPLNGSHVYLFAANVGSGTLGDAGPGIAPVDTGASANKSTSLLDPIKTGHSDSVGAYVVTGSDGSFTITGDYQCTQNTQVYLYVLGGDPGGGVNSHVGLLAALGNCPGALNFAAATPFVVVNEVSTIAAAYAFAGFATDATHVSSKGSPAALMGIKNAFANAANLATLSTGQPLAVTPGGNGIAPAATVYTLANILASCVNSTGTLSGPTNPTACYTLFNTATATTIVSGNPVVTVPSDTATAAINIAHNPAVGIDALYGLPTADAPFGSGLGNEPNDFTLALQFGGGGIASPNSIAIDSQGNAWMTNSGASNVTEFLSTGALPKTEPSTGYIGGGLFSPVNIAVDLSDNAWVANGLSSGGSVVELSPTGAIVANSTTHPNGYTATSLVSPYGIAIDGTGVVWVTNSTTSAISKLDSGGNDLLPGTGGYTGGNMGTPYGIAIDNTTPTHIWVANNGDSTVTELSTSGSFVSGSNGYGSGGLSIPYTIAIDNSGSAWIANAGDDTITKIAQGGSFTSGSSGYSGGGLNNPIGIAIDGASNAWVANEFGGGITEFSNTGTVQSGTNGYGYNDGSLDLPYTIAIDSSGNVWIGNVTGTSGDAINNGSVTELVGAAVPVVTPLSVGVENKTLGTRP